MHIQSISADCFFSSGHYRISCCTSTQMGRREAHLNCASPQLSPITAGQRQSGNARELTAGLSKNREHNSMTDYHVREGLTGGSIFDLLRESDIDRRIDLTGYGRVACETGTADLVPPGVNDLAGGDDAGLLTRPIHGVKTITKPEDMCSGAEYGGLESGEVSSDEEDLPETEVKVTGGDTTGEGKDDEELSETEVKVHGNARPDRIERMDAMIALLDPRSTNLGATVKDLQTSLEFSQKEILDLKKENSDLRLLLGNLEIEDRRTQFQVKDVADRVDKLDTSSKKKNLIFEGLPEVEGRREDVGKVVGDLFDQMNVNRGVNFEACFRIGPYVKSRTRPVLVTFERQADRDLVYAKRFDLKRSPDYHRVWVNEDLNPASKRKRELLRLIAREAQNQGIDCQTGKYAIRIDHTKFDDTNLEDLPTKLQPSAIKQIRIDQSTVAYQSEHAPFSNFFPSQIVIGKHRFFCAEQAFQLLRAKMLDKPLIATRIYLSRDVRYIKQLGREAGTSDEWEGCQFDYMYICLKKKFDQNPELKALLLSTGDMELVEATPDRLWGCGATLSSNVLRKREWSGKNKHGGILMTVRDDLRQAQRA